MCCGSGNLALALAAHSAPRWSPAISQPTP
jgi:hypothetical protein